MPIYQTAHYQVKADAVDKVTAAIEEFIRYVRDNEPGTRLYAAWQQESDPTALSTCSSSTTSRPTPSTASRPRYGSSSPSTRQSWSQGRWSSPTTARSP
jgi:hypothetical protein